VTGLGKFSLDKFGLIVNYNIPIQKDHTQIQLLD